MPDASIAVTADALARRLLQDLPSGQPIPPTAFDVLPSPIAGLLHSQVEARIKRETALPQTPWIDHGHDSVQEAKSAWQEAVRATARVPADAWEDTLTEVTRLAVGHLVQPAATLADHAFANEPATGSRPLASLDPLPTPLVLDRLRTFGPYPYLIEIVERYVEKKGLGHIDRDGLERLLLRIDSRMVSEFSPDDWLTLLDPLFELLGGTVSASLLKLAFEARGQRQLVADLDGADLTRDGVQAHLERQVGASQMATPPPTQEDPPPQPLADTPPPEPAPEPEPVSVSEPDDEDPPEVSVPLERPAVPHAFEVEPRQPAPPVIGSKFNAPEEVAPDDSDVLGPARPVEIVSPMVPMATLRAPSRSITDAVVTESMERMTDPADEPLWKRLAGPSDTPAPAADPPSEAAPLWAQFSPETAAPTSSSEAVTSAPPASAAPVASRAANAAPALRSDASLDTLELAVFGASDTDRRAWYTTELFSGDAEDYRETLLQLDAARTWTEATDIIARDVFRKHSVNIYSDPAITFTEAVEAQIGAR